MGDYATASNQRQILAEIQEINNNYIEVKEIYKNMNIGIYMIAFLIVLKLVIEIVKKALYTT